MVLIFAEQQTSAGFNGPAKYHQHQHQHAYPHTNAHYEQQVYGDYGYAAQAQPQQPAQKTKSVLAERYKTKMCRTYMATGACPYTHRCMFAHGQQELRTTDMNVRDGLMTEEAIRSFQRAMTANNRGEMAPEVQYPATHQHSQYTEQCPCDECVTAAANAATQHNPYYAAVPQAFAYGPYHQQE